jgi:primosomal protein N' (replication factor Y) (superfamily II helicase)
MLYVKVVLGLPLDCSFDYFVPKELEKEVSVGARVWVNFRNKKSVGYIVGLAKRTKIKKVKEVLGLIDKSPLLSKNLLKLARNLADYYCSSYGEAIEAMLPQPFRQGKPGDALQGARLPLSESGSLGSVPQVLEGREPSKRWEFYIKELKKAESEGNSAIVLFSDMQTLLKAKDIFEKAQIKDIFIFHRKEKDESLIWQEARLKQRCVVLGTRSAIFAPLNNLKLIIIDREEDSVYKQEQSPHYHARQIAFMRAKIEDAQVILESTSPSVESFFLTQEKKAIYQILNRLKPYPQISIVDTKRMPYAERRSKAIFPRVLTDAIFSTLSQEGKVLVFINRRGFATFSACHNCGKALKCPACNTSLVYHYDQSLLKCRHCAFKMALPDICPNCNAGYIKYSGLGTDKVESELARIFPQARIGDDIIASASAILKEEDKDFDLICVLNIDNALNRVDFMAAEKVFYLLSGLVALTSKKIIILTTYPRHHIFKSLEKKDPQIFYAQELKFRKQLKYPPFRSMALLKLRGRAEDKVKKAAEGLFEKLKEGSRGIEALSVNPGEPPKLRSNYYWQILFTASSPLTLSKFLKNNLKDVKYSGIIVTIDINPI